MGMEIIDINIYTRIIQNAFQRIFGKGQLVLIDPHPDIPPKHRQHRLHQLMRNRSRRRPCFLLHKSKQAIDTQRFVDHRNYYQSLRRKQFQQSILCGTIFYTFLDPDKSLHRQMAAVSGVDSIDRKTLPQSQITTYATFF